MKRDAVWVFLPTALLAFANLGRRDLAGEEVVFYFGLNPLQIAAQSLHPAGEGAFHAHQPLSYLARWVFVTLAGGPTPTSLRLHAALFACAAAVATWSVARRSGRASAVVAGWVVGVSPLLVFHAHEASGYAATALFSTLLLGGLLDLREGRRRGAWWLAAGVLGGLANDFFFALALPPALAFTPWASSLARRVWAGCAALVVPAAVGFFVSLGAVPETKRLSPHLDPLPAESASLIMDWLRVFGEAVVVGYTRGAEGAEWSPDFVLFGLMALTVASGVGAVRRRTIGAPEVGLATVWGVLLGAMAFTAFFASSGGWFAPAPRAVMAALPGLALAWTGASRIGAVAGLALTIAQLDASVAFVSQPTDGVARASERLAAELAADDLVVGTPAQAVALRGLLQRTVYSSANCPSPNAFGASTTVWVVGAGDPPCGIEGVLVHREPLPFPWHEGPTPSFLPPVVLSAYGVGVGRTGAFRRRVEVDGPATELALRLRRPDGVVRYQAVSAPVEVLDLSVPEGTVVEVRAEGAGASFVLDGPRSEQPVLVRTSDRRRGRVAHGAWLFAVLLAPIGAVLPRGRREAAG